MVVAETMLAISLVKGGIDLVKGALDSAEDVKGIYNGLDQLFAHKDEVDKQLVAKKKAVKPKSKLHQLFVKTTQEDDDDLSVGAVAAMVIEQKKLDREILNLSIRINNKFGDGTWEEIIGIREQKLEDRRVQHVKDRKAAKQKALEAEEMHQRMYRYALEFLKIVGVIIIAAVMFYAVWVNRCQGVSCS